MEDKTIRVPFTSGEPVTLRAMANMSEQDKDFYKDKASKMFGVSYNEVTKEQRAEAKDRLMSYIYGRSDVNPFTSEVD